MLIKNLKNYFILLVLFLALFKIISIYYTPLDSDEVMWSVMSERIVKFQENYWFFTDQVFRGSLESYIIAPFQYFFGVNELVLRINNFIFSILIFFLIYLILFYHTKNKLISSLGVVIYFFSLPGIFFIQNKAWGGYVTIQFLMLLIYYIISLKIDGKIATTFTFIVTGLLTGFSFWINEQSIFFLLFLLPFGLYYDYLNLLKTQSQNKKFIYSLFAFLYSLITYFIVKKRMFFNFDITLKNKFGLDSVFFNYNFQIKDVILLLSLIFIGILIYEYKTKKFFFQKSFFLNQAVFSYLIMYINLYFNSFSRVSSEKTFDIVKSWNFLVNIIVNQTLSYSIYLILPLVIVFFFVNIYFRFKSLDYNLRSLDLFFGSFFIFPLMFLISFLPGLSESPRYLILWWPITIVCVFLILSKFKLRYVFLGIILWFILIFYNSNQIYENINLKINQDLTYKSKIKLIKDQGFKYCVSGYWTAGITMFYSGLEVKCFTDRKYGLYYKFLDRYKIDDFNKVYINN